MKTLELYQMEQIEGGDAVDDAFEAGMNCGRKMIMGAMMFSWIGGVPGAIVGAIAVGLSRNCLDIA